MKKLVAVVLTVCAVAAFATTATASGPVYDESGILCGVIDRDGGSILTTDSRLIQYASGKVTLRCEAQGTPGSNIVVTEGFLCGLGPFGLTTDSSNRVGKNGHIQLTCTGFAEESAPASASASSVGAG